MIRGRRRSFVPAAVALLGLMAGAACTPAKPPASPPASTPDVPSPDDPPPPGPPDISTTQTVAGGLTHPWDLAFVDADTFLFTERAGQLNEQDGVSPSVELTGPSLGVVNLGEDGLMGIAVDPEFATNNFAYLCLSTASDNRLVRITVDLAANTYAGITPLLTGIPKANLHDGCRVRFGPDDALWATTGDAGVGTTPQDPGSLGGKVLRINRDGSIPPDNPDPASPIYTSGHRNVQGITFQPGTGVPYSAEHGPGINDEVNRLISGGNSGWDPVPGYNQSVPMTDLVKFPDAMIPAWRSGDSFTLAPSGATFLTGAQWGSWDGALAVAFLKDSCVRIMFLDGNGNVSSESRVLTAFGRIRSVVQGTDGDLYLATDNASIAGGPVDQIVRVTPS